MSATAEHNEPSPASILLEKLVAEAARMQATDVHVNSIAGPRQVYYRSRGRLRVAKSWPNITDDTGKLIWTGEYKDLSKRLLTAALGGSVVHRLRQNQIRVQVIESKAGNETAEKLFIRIQALRPPPLKSVLQHLPALQMLLENADGLVLIAGPVGGGKTTLAASVVDYWASKYGRHCVTIEDPVEYLLSDSEGNVTQIEAALTERPQKTSSILTSLDSAATAILRADLDALFVGECRDQRGACLALASASAAEPVITTIQAGGIADAVVRILNLASGKLGPEVARLTLASCLHAIVYVNLSFGKDGQPIPVIMSLPVATTRVRRLLSESKPEELAAKIEQYMKDHKDPALVTPEAAIQAARAAGADHQLTLQALRQVNALALSEPPKAD